MHQSLKESSPTDLLSKSSQVISVIQKSSIFSIFSKFHISNPFKNLSNPFKGFGDYLSGKFSQLSEALFGDSEPVIGEPTDVRSHGTYGDSDGQIDVKKVVQSTSVAAPVPPSKESTPVDTTVSESTAKVSPMSPEFGKLQEVIEINDELNDKYDLLMDKFKERMDTLSEMSVNEPEDGCFLKNLATFQSHQEDMEKELGELFERHKDVNPLEIAEDFKPSMDKVKGLMSKAPEHDLMKALLEKKTVLDATFKTALKHKQSGKMLAQELKASLPSPVFNFLIEQLMS